MTPEELYEAIDATIVKNGQRGITAESLAALLRDIVANAGGGGSGQGALRVYTLQQTSGLSTELGDEYESLIPGSKAIVDEYLALNAATYQQVWSTPASDFPMIMLDVGSAFDSLMAIVGEEYGGGGATIPISATKASPIIEGNVEEVILLIFDPVKALDAAVGVGLNAYTGFILRSDGSVTYHAAEES